VLVGVGIVSTAFIASSSFGERASYGNSNSKEASCHHKEY